MINNKAIHCAIYIRVSTEEQHLNGLSLPAQRKALEEYAESKGYKIVGYYADEGVSARKPMSKRKELLRLLEDVKQHKIDMILVTKLDRWFRNIKDYNITEEILANHNCYWKTIFENYDSSTANGQMVINIMLSVNQAECDRTSERIKAVLDYKRANGEVTSGRLACFGYTTENNRLIKDTDTQPIVEEMFTHYFGCFSKRKTYKHLQSIFGNRVPPYATYSRLFRREQYYGRVQGIDNACEPYISHEQHCAISSIKDAKDNSKKRHYIFSTLVKCPTCGNNLGGFIKTDKKPSGKIFYYPKYRCNKKIKYSCSNGIAISENVVEKYVLDNVLGELDNLVVLVDSQNKDTPIKNELPGLTEELSRLNNMYQKGRITESHYEEQYEMIYNKINEIENTTQIKAPTKAIEVLSGNWYELYIQLDKEHKNVFWKSILKEVTIDESTRKPCGIVFL